VTLSMWLQAAGLFLAVFLFYLLTWFWWGKDPQPGTIVTRYDPPNNLSPALMRYIWKQGFDERVFWAGLLNLVSRGLATLEKKADATYIKPVWPPRKSKTLPDDEAEIYRELAHHRAGLRLSLADPALARAALKMAASLHVTQRGIWFTEHRNVVLAGSVLSGIAMVMAAKPTRWDQLMALTIPAVLIAVGAFYGYFLAQRIVDLTRVARHHVRVPVVRRLMLMVMLAIPSAAAVAFGAIELYGNFGPALLALGGALTLLNLLFLRLMKAPTRKGRALLDEIEGFRHFLGMVEHRPLDSPDAPKATPGLYEKYLPYALALEVEQQWCDQTAALGSSDDEIEELGEAVPVYHIGMWGGRPVKIAYDTKLTDEEQ